MAVPPYLRKPFPLRVWRPGGVARSRAAISRSGAAGWLARAGSAVVDQLVCQAIIAPIAVLVVIAGIIDAMLSRSPFQDWPGLLGVTGYATAIVGAVTGPYYVLLEGRRAGQTLGKMAANIRVVDHVTGGPIGWGQAVVRWLARLLLWVTVPLLTLGAGLMLALLDVLWPLWDERKQALHDKLAGTLVVPAAPRSSWM